MLTDHSNHLKPQAHVHFNSESKDIFTKNILPQLIDKKNKLEYILQILDQSQKNEITFSATKYQNLINDTIDVVFDKQLVQELDLSKQQTLVSKNQNPQYEEKKKGYQDIEKRFKLSGILPKDQGFMLKTDNQANQQLLNSFREQVDTELSESFVLHTVFGDQLDIDYKLLYKGTNDGFSEAIYKQKCYHFPNLIIFILSEFDQVFGAFVSEIQQNKNGYIPDKGAFLFQLTKRQLILQYQNLGNAIYCTNGHFATFGGGHDLHLSNNCDQNNSFQSFGN
eukprot:403335916